MGKGAALEDIPPAACRGNSTAGADRQGQAAAKAAAVRCTLDSPLPAVRKHRRRRGIYTTRAMMREGRALGTKCLEVEISCWLQKIRYISQFCGLNFCNYFLPPPRLPTQKSRPILTPDGFLCNVIDQILFFVVRRLRKVLYLQCSY